MPGPRLLPILAGMPRIVWWEIETPSPEAFQRFHAELWGWEYERAFTGTELGADYWIIKDAGQGIGGLQRSATSARPRAGTRLYVEVDDLEETLRRVAALGGKIERVASFSQGPVWWPVIMAARSSGCRNDGGGGGPQENRPRAPSRSSGVQS